MQSRAASFPNHQKKQQRDKMIHMIQTSAWLSAAQTLHVTVPNRHQQCLSQFQHTIFHLLTKSPQQILARLLPFTTSLDLTVHFSPMRSSLEFILSELNSLPFPYANKFPATNHDTCACNRCHPLLLQILKPVRTTGDGNCMYNALSLTLTGAEQFSDLIRLLCAYALVKYKDTMISAFISVQHGSITRTNVPQNIFTSWCVGNRFPTVPFEPANEQTNLPL